MRASKRRTYVGAVPVVAASLSAIAISVADHCGAILAVKVVVYISVLATSIGGYVLLRRMEFAELALRERQEKLNAILDAAMRLTAKGGDPLDPQGDLNVRMNVMLPYKHVFPRRLRTAYDRPARDSADKNVVFHMYACSRNSRGRPSLWAGWRYGQGCTGQLWEDGGCVAAAIMPAGADLSRYNMTSEQERQTQDTRCVVSVAVTQGIGVDLWRKGVLNISSSNAAAIDVWTEDGGARPEVASYLVHIADNILDFLPE